MEGLTKDWNTENLFTKKKKNTGRYPATYLSKDWDSWRENIEEANTRFGLQCH